MKIHWDGKSVENITNRKLVERLVIKAVCESQEQILGCPVSGKKAIAVANTVFKAIQEWELEEQVVSLCFDTTNVNAGRVKGAAIILERLLGRSLIYFPCRHHIYELILKLVYEFFMGKSKADIVLLFENFKKAWDSIDQSEYVAGIVDPDVAAAVNPQLRQRIKNFVEDKMKNKIFR